MAPAIGVAPLVPGRPRLRGRRCGVGMTDLSIAIGSLRLKNPLLAASGYAHIEVYLNEVAQTLTGQTPTLPGTPVPPTNLRVTP